MSSYKNFGDIPGRLAHARAQVEGLSLILTDKTWYPNDFSSY
jgi:hypothetical protein